MRAHLVQLDIAWEDPQANFEAVDRMIEPVGVLRDELIVLPELFDTGFSLATERTADKQGRTLAYLCDLARRHGAIVQGGRTILAEVAPDRDDSAMALNVATVAGPDGSVVCEYAKVHPFSFGRESERFAGGPGATTYNWQAGTSSLRVCPAICYDLRFPELFRQGVMLGAELIVLGANWPETRQDHWRSLLIARAIENQAFVLGVNRTGSDPHLAYAGGSIAIDPRGTILGEIGSEERVLTVDLDPQVVIDWRATFPALRDIRLMPGPQPNATARIR